MVRVLDIVSFDSRMFYLDAFGFWVWDSKGYINFIYVFLVFRFGKE